MSSPHFLPNDHEKLLRVPNPQHEIEISLRNIVDNYPPKDSYEIAELRGFWTGPTSVALLFFYLSRSQPDLSLKDRSPVQWCKLYLAGSRPPVVMDSGHCGLIGDDLCVLALKAIVEQDPTHITEFMTHLSPVLAGTTLEASELLFGGAGTLYLLRLMRTFLPEHAALTVEPTRRLIHLILQSGPPWIWRNMNLFGAAHGTVSIVTQIALSSPSDDSIVLVRPVLEQLLDSQREDGNWPPLIDRHPNVDQVQFCHGAPGIVISLKALMKAGCFPDLDNRMESAIQRARSKIWEMGLLTKEPCLCHGASGNALALEGQQREHFLAYSTSEMVEKGISEGWYEKASKPWSLQFGEAGRVWAFMSLLTDRDIGYIGYNDV